MDIETKIAAAAKEVAWEWYPGDGPIVVGLRPLLEKQIATFLRKHLTEPPAEEMPKCVDCDARTVVRSRCEHSIFWVSCAAKQQHTNGAEGNTESEAIAAYRKLTGSRLVLPLDLCLRETAIVPVTDKFGNQILAFFVGEDGARKFSGLVEGRRVLSPIPVDIRVEATNAKA